MKPYTHGNIVIDIWTRAGVVLSSQVRSETHVSSSGGGGYITDGTGYVNAPQLHSRIERQQDIWFKKSDGVQENVRLKNCDFPLLPGQRITFVSAKKQGADSGYYMILINHDAAKWWWISRAGEFADWSSLLSKAPVKKEGGGCCGCLSLMLALALFGAGALASQDMNNTFNSLNTRDSASQALNIAVGLGLVFLAVAVAMYIRNRSREKDHTREMAAYSANKSEMLNGLEAYLSKIGTETSYSG